MKLAQLVADAGQTQSPLQPMYVMASSTAGIDPQFNFGALAGGFTSAIGKIKQVCPLVSKANAALQLLQSSGVNVPPQVSQVMGIVGQVCKLVE
jgi:hypothetical protein